MRSELYAAGMAALVTHVVFFIFVGCPGIKANCFGGNTAGGRIHGHQSTPTATSNHQGSEVESPPSPYAPTPEDLSGPRDRKRRQANQSEHIKLFIASLQAFDASVAEIKNKYSNAETNVHLDKAIAKNTNILKYAKMIWPEIGGGKEVPIKLEVFTENIKTFAHYYLGLDEKTLPQLIEENQKSHKGQKCVDHQASDSNNQHQHQDPFQKFKQSLEDFATSFKEFKEFIVEKEPQMKGVIHDVLAKNGNILAIFNAAALLLPQSHTHCSFMEVKKFVQQENAKALVREYMRKVPEQSHPPTAAGQRAN